MNTTVPDTRRNGTRAKRDKRKVPQKRARPKTELGRRIDALAAGLGISRTDMAKECGVIPVSFNRTLVSSNVQARHITSIASLLGVSAHFLLTGEDDGRLPAVRKILDDAREKLADVEMILATYEQ